MLRHVNPKPPAAGNRKARRQAEKRNRKAAAGMHAAQRQSVAVVLQRAEDARRAGRLDEAESICRQAVHEFPDQSAPHVGLAVLLEAMGRGEEAYGFYKQAAAIAPNDFETWHQFGLCLYRLRQFEAATIALKNAVALEPRNHHAHMELGHALAKSGKVEEAVQVYDQVLALKPGSAQAQFSKGAELQALGRFDMAKSCFHRAIELDPDMAPARLRLVKMEQSDDEQAATLDELSTIADQAGLNAANRASAFFSMAEVMHRRNDHDAAFEHYAKANNLLQTEHEFNRETFKQSIDDTINGFTPAAVASLAGAASLGAVPVFIVGMPRSGTTLAEAILSSHPDVEAGGEQLKFAQLVSTLKECDNGKLRYPHDASEIMPELLAPLGSEYLSHMARQFPDAGRITDKLPFNFLHLGLIAILFPDAVIIHCKRDPMDTCLSCYFQNFAETRALSFSCSLEDLGFYYLQYARLMAHWHDILPGRIIDLAYEDVVSAQEETSRHLIESIGLAWDDACLTFYENENSVRTASQLQVRKPIYSSSAGKWRKYERHLGALQEALNYPG